MTMTIDKARETLKELSDVLGEPYAEAVKVLLEHEPEPRRRVGAREKKIMDYMSKLPGVPLTPGAVQAATQLEHTPAAAMANLAAKGLLTRLGSGALYVFPEEAEATEES
jgi:hypothetical protein